MSDYGRYDDEMRRLQDQTRRNRSEIDEMRRGLEREYRGKLDACRSELRRELESHDRAAQRKYEAALREYQKNTASDAMQAKLEMDGKYRSLAKSVQDAERELADRTRRLEEDARKRRDAAAARDRLGAEEAAKSIEGATRAWSEMDGTPHRFFFPNRLATFHNALKDASELLKLGMTEAAAAIAISARSGMERLGFDVKDKQEEWNRLFSLLRARTASLRSMIDGELAEWIESIRRGKRHGTGDLPDGEARAGAIELDYWSKGAYSETLRGVEELEGLIADVTKIGTRKYLKSGGALDASEIEARLESADRLSDAACGLFDISAARYAASCERLEWGDAITDFFSGEINLTWLEEESGWKEADEKTRSGETFRAYASLQYGDAETAQDAREWLELAFRNDAGTRVFVYIVPEESDSGFRNRVLLYVDHAWNDEGYAGEIYAHLLESLRTSEGEGVAVLVTDASGLALNPDAVYRGTGASLEKKLKEH
ncbi:MAG: hypothetical protein LBQ19_00285 [Synergistaceae bacterium]|jgi:hypothetical protein|nr:hypothetical protein [Synergistaceae bacterium]